MSDAASRLRRLTALILKGFLLLATAISLVAVLLIIAYIARDALPFFKLRGLGELFKSTAWYPSGRPARIRRPGHFLRQRPGHARRHPGGRAAGHCRGDLPERHPALPPAPDRQAGHRDPGRHPVRGLRILRPGHLRPAAAEARRLVAGHRALAHRPAPGPASHFRGHASWPRARSARM